MKLKFIHIKQFYSLNKIYSMLNTVNNTKNFSVSLTKKPSENWLCEEIGVFFCFGIKFKRNKAYPIKMCPLPMTYKRQEKNIVRIKC